MIFARGFTVAAIVAEAFILQPAPDTRALAPCGRSTDAECYLPRPGGPLFLPSTDGAPIGADTARLVHVERCVLGGVSTAPDCLALTQTTPPPTTSRIEGPKSAPVTFRRPMMKWDMPAPSLAVVQTYGWILYVDNVARDLAGVVCTNATGATPIGSFSCTVDVPDVPTGVHSLEISAWVAPTAPVTPTAARVLIQ